MTELRLISGEGGRLVFGIWSYETGPGGCGLYVDKWRQVGTVTVALTGHISEITVESENEAQMEAALIQLAKELEKRRLAQE
ncbi:MAG: hypothetical protein WC683_04675 [bacterium]